MQKMIIGDIHIDVVHKLMKNVRLSVHPPLGRVRISAPFRMDLDTIRVFAISKLNWIKKHQHNIRLERNHNERFIALMDKYFPNQVLIL